MYRTGEPDWYKAGEILFLVAMQGRQYRYAFELFKQFTTRSDFSKCPDLTIETWRIFELYIRYVLPDVFGRNSVFPARFEFEVFSRQIPRLRSDKVGYNVLAQLACILFLFREHDCERLFEKIESFYNYCTVNKLHEINPKLHYLSRALNHIVKENFSRNSVFEAKRKFIEELNGLNHSGSVDAIEIIDIEELFNLINNDVQEIQDLGIVVAPSDSRVVASANSKYAVDSTGSAAKQKESIVTKVS